MNSCLLPMKDLLAEAESRKIAIGAFEFWSYEVARAIVSAAKALNLPVILQCGSLEIDRMGGLEGTVETARRAVQGSGVSAALHLDHAIDEHYCLAAIDAGFTSVMFDGSSLPFKENSEITRRVSEYAHRFGASSEGELGRLRGEEGAIENPEDAQTDPEEAVRFYEITRVDALALSIGTAHGVYNFEPKLNIGRLQAIHALLPDVPLVLHGGSGTPIAQVQASIRNGIRKVNICTEIQLAMGRAYTQVQAQPNFKYNCENLWGAAETAARELVMEKMRFFALEK